MEGSSSSSLTIQQEIVMIVLGTISSIISVTGSSMIIVHLYYRYRKKPTTTNSKKPKSSRWPSSSNTTTSKNNNENLVHVATTTLTTYVTTTTTTTTTQTQEQHDEATTTIRRRMGVRTNRTLNTANNTKNTMLGTTDRRIIFLMSLFDIIQSTNLLIQPFVLDRYDKHFHIGYGTSRTCHMAAAIHHISNAGGMYACMLNYYYLLTVRYGWSQHKLNQSKVEYLMHGIAFLWPFITAIVGTIIGVWGNEPFFMGCWVGEYPTGCKDNPDVRCKGPLFGATTAVPMYVVYLCTLFISNTLLFLHVRKISQKSLFWGFQNQSFQLQIQQQSPAVLTADATTTDPGETVTPTTTTSSTVLGQTIATSSEIFPIPATTRHASAEVGFVNSTSNCTNHHHHGQQQQQQQQQQQSSSSSSRLFHSNNGGGGWLSSSSFLSLGTSSNSRRDLSSSSVMMMNDRQRSSLFNTTTTGDYNNNTNTIETIHRKRLRRVGMQGVYYLVAGGIVYTPFLITQEILYLFPNVTQNQVYVLLVIQAIVLPLDGFFNSIIYFRPRYLDIRYNKQTGVIQKSFFETLYQCVFGESRQRCYYSPKNRRRRTKQQTSRLSLYQQQQEQRSKNMATTDLPLQKEQQQQQESTDTNSYNNVTTSTSSTNNKRRLSRATKNDLNGLVAQQLLDRINEEPGDPTINPSESTTERNANNNNDGRDEGGEELLLVLQPSKDHHQPKTKNGCSVFFDKPSPDNDDDSTKIIMDSTRSNVYDDDDSNNNIRKSPTRYDDTVDNYDNRDNDNNDNNDDADGEDYDIVNNFVVDDDDDGNNTSDDSDDIDDDIDEGEIIFEDNCYDEQK